VQADMLTCYTLLEKPVEKPKKWKYGEKAPYEGADCCPAYACRKLAGVPMGKTGARSKKKQKADVAAAAAAMGALAPLERAWASASSTSRCSPGSARTGARRCQSRYS